MSVIPAKDKLACIEREVRMRRRVYPRWVEQKRMSQMEADRQIAIMEAISEDYRQLEQKDRLL